MMKDQNIYAPLPNALIKNVMNEFSRGVRLIGKIEDAVYRRTTDGTGSIGGHFRHNLDFANSFLNGLRAGKIDYNRRERDLRVEENRRYAIKRFALMICRLRRLPPEIFRKKMAVRSEVDTELWHESSAMRELEFLHSHTIHHHALIAEKLGDFGVKVETGFGVAPSTRQFWERMKRSKSPATSI